MPDHLRASAPAASQRGQPKPRRAIHDSAIARTPRAPSSMPLRVRPLRERADAHYWRRAERPIPESLGLMRADGDALYDARLHMRVVCQREVATRLGLTQPQWSTFERSGVFISREYAEQIAAVLRELGAQHGVAAEIIDGWTWQRFVREAERSFTPPAQLDVAAVRERLAS